MKLWSKVRVVATLFLGLSCLGIRSGFSQSHSSGTRHPQTPRARSSATLKSSLDWLAQNSRFEFKGREGSLDFSAYQSLQYHLHDTSLTVKSGATFYRGDKRGKKRVVGVTTSEVFIPLKSLDADGVFDGLRTPTPWLMFSTTGGRKIIRRHTENKGVVNGKASQHEKSKTKTEDVRESSYLLYFRSEAVRTRAKRELQQAILLANNKPLRQ